MIAIESVPASLLTRRTLPVALEFSVRCQAEVDFTVASIMSAMGKYPFAPSDGLAVQLAVSEALRIATEEIPDPERDYLSYRVRAHVTAQFVRVQVEEVSTRPNGTIPNVFDRFRDKNDLNGRSLKLMRTYMTSIETRKEGRQLILYRARGQGAGISGPPIGYDFQI